MPELSKQGRMQGGWSSRPARDLPPMPRRPCGSCGAPGRFYMTGWKCPKHTPAALAGRPESTRADTEETP